jgi:hypothetical protein
LDESRSALSQTAGPGIFYPVRSHGIRQKQPAEGSPTPPFQPPSPSKLPVAGEKKDSQDGRIEILDTRLLSNSALMDYFEKRCIPLDIAGRSCLEVDFLLYGKRQTVIGFPNRSGGYELRNANFKGSSSPKDISFIDHGTGQIAVFEGFFSYLSFLTINKNREAPLSNCLILNSLAFLEKSRPLMEKHERIHLVLDNDTAGKSHMQKALGWSDKYIDRSEFYRHHKDLNEWLKANRQEPKQQLRRGRSI